jgi:hypothetical protein
MIVRLVLALLVFAGSVSGGAAVSYLSGRNPLAYAQGGDVLSTFGPCPSAGFALNPGRLCFRGDTQSLFVWVGSSWSQLVTIPGTGSTQFQVPISASVFGPTLPGFQWVPAAPSSADTLRFRYVQTGSCGGPGSSPCWALENGIVPSFFTGLLFSGQDILLESAQGGQLVVGGAALNSPFSATTAFWFSDSAADIRLGPGTGVLEQRLNGTVQRYSLYNDKASISGGNWERLTLTGTVGGDFIIRSQALGTGVVRNILVDPGTADIKWGKALVALGGGAAPTFGTIGGTGPTAAAQNAWMRVLDSTGAAFWIPVWK